MLLGFAPIGDTGWYVVVEEPWDNIAGEVARYRWALAGLGEWPCCWWQACS